MPTYRVQSAAGHDLGLLEHHGPNAEPGDVFEQPDGREALVTAPGETSEAPVAAQLDGLGAPSSPPSPTA